MRKFKIGDKIRCITKIFEEHYGLYKGKIYTIDEIDVAPNQKDTRYLFKGVGGRWGLQSKDYFELVQDFATIVDAPDKSELFRYLKREADNII